MLHIKVLPRAGEGQEADHSDLLQAAGKHKKSYKTTFLSENKIFEKASSKQVLSKWPQI